MTTIKNPKKVCGGPKGTLRRKLNVWKNESSQPDLTQFTPRERGGGKTLLKKHFILLENQFAVKKQASSGHVGPQIGLSLRS